MSEGKKEGSLGEGLGGFRVGIIGFVNGWEIIYYYFILFLSRVFIFLFISFGS